MSGSYLDDKTFDSIRQNIAAKIPHCVAAYEKLITAADAALSGELPSVTHNGGSPHFRQDAAYVPGQDGVYNTDRNDGCRQLMMEFSQKSFDLALAWKLTGDEKYAERCLEYIHCWCINQNTKMLPDGRVWDHFTAGMGYGGDICIFANLPQGFLAMYLMSDYGNWNIDAHAAVKRWVRAMIEPQTPEMFFEGVSMYNNWEDNRLNYLACGALFLDDLDILHDVFNRWREIIPLKMDDEGVLPREAMRTRSFTYTLFALNMACMVADIACGFGEDLHNYSINGKSLKLAIDYMTKYALDIDNWPHEQIEKLVPGQSKISVGLFEFAYNKWGDQKYLDAIELWSGRPVDFYHWTLLQSQSQEN